MVYLNMAYLIPSCIMAAFLGSYTDRVGRKTVLLFPMVAGTLRTLLYLVIIQLKLNMNFLLLANLIDGLSGGSTTVITCCFAYIADISSAKDRSIRIFLVELGTSVGVGVSQIYTGYMIKSLGYVYPFLLLEALHAVNLLFVIFYIQETVVPRGKVGFLSFAHLKKTAGLFIKDDGTNRRWKLQILVLVSVLNYMVDIGSGDVYTVYILGAPFCFSSILIGYFNAALYFLRSTGSIIFLKIFKRCLDDVSLMMIGNISGIASQVIMALAMNKILLFICKSRDLILCTSLF